MRAYEQRGATAGRLRFTLKSLFMLATLGCIIAGYAQGAWLPATIAGIVLLAVVEGPLERDNAVD